MISYAMDKEYTYYFVSGQKDSFGKLSALLPIIIILFQPAVSDDSREP